MIQLRSLLRTLEATPTGKLELMSGRRPRILLGSEVKNLSDEILTDDHVLDLCRQAAGDARLDALAEAPVAWLASSPIGKIRVVAGMKGREVLATIVMVREPAVRAEERGLRTEEGARREEVRRDERPDPRRERRSSRAAPPPAAADPRRAQTTPDRSVRASRRPSTAAASAARQSARDEAPQTVRDETPPRASRHEPATTERAREPRPEPLQPRPDDGPLRQPPPALAATLHSPREASTRDDRRAAAPQRPPHNLPPQQRLFTKRLVPTVIIDLLRRARSVGASDLHLGGGVVYARTPAGLIELSDAEPLQDHHMAQVLESFLTERERAELEQQGGVSFAADVSKSLRVRVNATTTLDGPKLALRLLHASAPSFEQLGLPSELVSATDHPQGLVVVTGPSGQGKTTTIAALVQHINVSRAAHVIMVEDPIEVPVSSAQSVVSQRQVGLHAKSFARALEGALRQDPDVIVIGELRDVETVRIALAASETGHLVLGSMNAPTTKSVIDRLIDLFPPSDQPQVRHTLGGGLRMVCNQRLVPRITPPEERAQQGKLARAAAFELLPGSPALWSLIRDDKMFQLPSLLQRGKGAGILRLNDSLAELVARGEVALEAALGVSEDPRELERIVSGAASAARSPEPVPAPEPQGALGGLINKAGAIFGRRGGGNPT